MRILVIEDDPIFRDIVKDIVNSNFTSVGVAEARNGKEALTQFGQRSPDLIFMDIQLPTTNGLELTKHFKTIDPDIHIIILTNHDTPEYREAAREYGADHFISKASSIQKEIIEVVRLALKSKSL